MTSGTEEPAMVLGRGLPPPPPGGLFLSLTDGLPWEELGGSGLMPGGGS